MLEKGRVHQFKAEIKCMSNKGYLKFGGSWKLRGNWDPYGHQKKNVRGNGTASCVTVAKIKCYFSN